MQWCFYTFIASNVCRRPFNSTFLICHVPLFWIRASDDRQRKRSETYANTSQRKYTQFFRLVCVCVCVCVHVFHFNSYSYWCLFFRPTHVQRKQQQFRMEWKEKHSEIWTENSVWNTKRNFSYRSAVFELWCMYMLNISSNMHEMFSAFVVVVAVTVVWSYYDAWRCFISVKGIDYV